MWKTGLCLASTWIVEGNHDYILLLDRKVCIGRGKEERTSRVMLWNCRLLSLLFRHQLLAISSSQLPRTHIWAYNTFIAINHSSIETISRTGSTNVAETRFHAVSFMKTATRTKNSTSESPLTSVARSCGVAGSRISFTFLCAWCWSFRLAYRLQ